MKSFLSSTNNTRPVLPGSLRYVRSDVPHRLTAEETEWLLAQNLRTIVDLRTAAEQQRKPCPLAEDGRFTYLHLPVTGGDGVPAAPEAVAASYIRMASDGMQGILAAIRNAPTNVLFFCNAGKDRTGVVSAILQKEASLPDAYILDDYVLSGENLREQLAAFAAADPAIDIRVITPQRAYMAEFLRWYDANEKEVHLG